MVDTVECYQMNTKQVTTYAVEWSSYNHEQLPYLTDARSNPGITETVGTSLCRM